MSLPQAMERLASLSTEVNELWATYLQIKQRAPDAVQLNYGDVSLPIAWSDNLVAMQDMAEQALSARMYDSVRDLHELITQIKTTFDNSVQPTVANPVG
jgi:hypothetical protein